MAFMGRIENPDIRKLAQEFGAVPVRLRPLTKKVVQKTALDIERDAKLKAPVDTGNLKGSIGHSDLRLGGTDYSVEIGPTANYGVFVERGTSRMAPQPYLGPAADRHEGPFAQAMAQIAEEALGG